MYVTHPHQVLSDQHFDQLLENGYVILPRFIRGDELRELQAAQRRVLRSWDQVRDNPPQRRTEQYPYAWSDTRMSRLYLHPELLKIGRRYLKTDDVQARTGYMLTRYPGFVSVDTGHIDNGNNSLLPMSESAREYGQLVYWIHLEEVKEGQAPLRLGKHRNGRDTSQCEPLICPEGTICIFTNYTWHASSSFTANEGQRFVWGFGLGRSDHMFEGLVHYTSLGNVAAFNKAVCEMSPDERTLFRFPKPNHPYYTRQTLAALEAQYPGWNKSGAYKPMD